MQQTGTGKLFVIMPPIRRQLGPNLVLRLA